MGSRAKSPGEGQEGLRGALRALVAGAVEARTQVLSWVQEVGVSVLEEVLRGEAESLAGPKGKHFPGREANHWGRASASLPFGGRRITIERQRVRGRDGREKTLPTLEALRRHDAMSERVLEQVLLGVSTRGYRRSLEESPRPSRGTSKSAVSRRLKTAMRTALDASLSQPLGEKRLAALLLDGVSMGEGTIVVALGILADGTKEPLGLHQGSTENATVCAALLQDLLSRGLVVGPSLLCVIDGGKGLRKALLDVFGDQVVIQRCQVHKRRNVLGHLPQKLHLNVARQLTQAYRSEAEATAKKHLKALQGWLARAGHEGAAASLAEGLDETLTVTRLRLPRDLRRSLATTNAIESALGRVRKTTRNVKRWRGGDMARRWCATALLEARKGFRRIKGYKNLPALAAALERDDERRNQAA